MLKKLEPVIIFCAVCLFIVIAIGTVSQASDSPLENTTVLQSDHEDFVWHNGLRQRIFGDRVITQSDDVVTLQAPKRAEDPAVVPLKVIAAFPQSERRYIKTVVTVQSESDIGVAKKWRPRVV